MTQQMTFTAYYTSQDSPNGPWSVYSEQYWNRDDAEPIDGSSVRVETGFATEAAADVRANELSEALDVRILP
jgi:hypothetical protein